MCCALALLAWACTADDPMLDLRDIYLDYQVLYDADRDSTFVFAGFWVGSSQVLLSADASAKANQVELIFNPQPGYSYEAGFTGRVNDFTLVYSDGAGGVYTNGASFAYTDTIDIDLDSLALGVAHEIRWSGERLQADEEVALEIYTSAPPSDYQNYQGLRATQSQPGTASITVASGAFDVLGPGRRAYTLTRTKTQPVTNSTPAGGRVRLSWGTGVRRVLLY
ncbi:MAG: hypothetical protein WBA12_11465 [Catalinimonas sp.]